MRNRGLINGVCHRLSGHLQERQSITGAVLVSMLLFQTSVWATSNDKPQLLELPAAPADANASTQKPQPVPAAPTTPQAAGNNTTLQLLPLPDANTSPPIVAASPATSATQPNVPAAPTSPSSPIPAQNGTPAIAIPAPPVVPVTPIVPAPAANNTPALPHSAQLPANSNAPQLTPVTPPSPTPVNTSVPSPAVVATGTDKPADSDHSASTSHDSNLTLMFSSDEMAIITKMLKAYDSYDEHKPVQSANADLIELFPTETAPTPQNLQIDKLPNLYCGSIVYYSPQTWLVTVNGVKLTNTKNTPGAEFYISEISRKEIVLIWKPHSLNEVPSIWNEKTDNGKTPLQNINVDASNGTITLHMRPNQTFIPDTLEIREGLIRSGGFFTQIKNAIGSATSGRLRYKNGQ